MNSILLSPTNILNLRCVADESIYFAWTIELWRNLDYSFSIYNTNFIFCFTSPPDFFAQFLDTHFNELPNWVSVTSGYDLLVSFFLLKHEPHCIHIVLGVTPVSGSVKVTEFKELLFTFEDVLETFSNLLCDKV